MTTVERIADLSEADSHHGNDINDFSCNDGCFWYITDERDSWNMHRRPGRQQIIQKKYKKGKKGVKRTKAETMERAIQRNESRFSGRCLKSNTCLNLSSRRLPISRSLSFHNLLSYVVTHFITLRLTESMSLISWRHTPFSNLNTDRLKVLSSEFVWKFHAVPDIPFNAKRNWLFHFFSISVCWEEDIGVW